MVSQIGALGRHIALVGFMGAGKTTVGRRVAAATHRPLVDADEEFERRHGPIAAFFAERGEAEFRRLEELVVAEALATPEPAVIALGGGAVLSPVTRDRLGQSFVVHLDVDVDEAWNRVARTDRPLARDPDEFRELFESRASYYVGVRDEAAADAEGVLLAALQIVLEVGGVTGAVEIATGDPFAVIVDGRVRALHEPPFLSAAVGVHELVGGEDTKTLAVVERLWHELTLGREGVIVALGGGSTTDVAGFVAATYLRGVAWIAAPTTLTGQVDAAIGGKTGINTADGKNLAGAFHFPGHVLIDPSLLATLPEEERRAGLAEVVKTGLLAGRPVWELSEEEMIRACAAYKAGVVLSDPYETEGRRAWLNLGHTFAHALEAGSGYRVPHGEAVALGLLAALRLSGQPTDAVEEILRPEPVGADLDAAWAALKRDKKGEGVFVLLGGPGKPVVTTVADADARSALAALVRG